jgi:endonuclease/exonuclease/phosphatase (EEP) superfamily protein YafD
MENLGFRHLACSLHAATRRYPDANTGQLLHALNLVRSWDDGGYLPIVGGDFNYPYSGMMVTPLREWWGEHLVPEHEQHREAFLPQWRATHYSSVSMLDYIFVRLPQFQLRQRVYCEEHRNLSDHGWCPGLFWVR